MASKSLDFLFVGGTVVDGTGAAPYQADVGVIGDRVVAIGNLNAMQAHNTIQATGDENMMHDFGDEVSITRASSLAKAIEFFRRDVQV